MPAGAPVREGRQGISCPRCHSHTRVIRTEAYDTFSRRTRLCKNIRCNHVFHTVEKIITADADLFDERD